MRVKATWRAVAIVSSISTMAGGCAAMRPRSKPAEAKSARIVYDACIPIEIDEGRADGAKNVELYAHFRCQIAEGTCRTDPSSEQCKNVLRHYSSGMTAEGPSTLYRASETGRTAIVRALLEIGSDPDEPVTGPGWMPLMIASAEGHREIVLLLLQAGAKVDTLNARGRAALMFAAQYGYSDIVCDLLEQGADPNIVPSDRKRRTALVAAAYKGHEETVPILVENGADVTVKDKKGSHGVDERRIARSFRSGEHSASPITDRASPP